MSINRREFLRLISVAGGAIAGLIRWPAQRAVSGIVKNVLPSNGEVKVRFSSYGAIYSFPVKGDVFMGEEISLDGGNRVVGVAMEDSCNGRATVALMGTSAIEPGEIQNAHL